MTIGFVKHLHAVAHNVLMAELLEVHDSGEEVLAKHGSLPGAERVREKLKVVDATYAALSDRLRKALT